MFNQFQHRGWHYAVLLAVGAVLFFVNLGQASLWDVDEGRNITCSGEMKDSGNYVEPHFNSKLRVDKPVLLYWFQVVAFNLIGVNETAGRLPSALAALATLLVCYELGRSMYGKMTGLLAGLMVAGMPLVFALARFANPDALFHLFLVLTMFCYWQSRHGAWWSFAMGASSGLAVLAKGPIGVLLPLASVACYRLWNRDFRIPARRRVLLASLAFYLAAVPWYTLVAVETRGRFIEDFMMIHNVNRFLSTTNLHSGFVWYYPIALAVGTMPWAIFCVPAFRYAFAPLAVSRSTKSNRATRFLLTWLVVITLFFTLAATKLPNYILPVVVPFALLTANFLVRWCAGEVEPPTWMIHCILGNLVLIGVCTLVGAVIAGGVWRLPGVKHDVFPGLERGALLAIFPITGAALGWWLWRRGQRAGVVGTITLASLAYAAPLAIWGGAFWDAYKAPRSLVEQTNMRRPDCDVVVACWKMEHLPSLNFYCRRDVVHCETTAQLLDYLTWDSARWNIDVYLILATKDWKELKSQVTAPYRELAHHYDIFHHAEVVVVSNR